MKFFGQSTIHVQRYFVFASTVELRTLYPGTSLYKHILWIRLEKNRTYARTFPKQRKEINAVKVRFTMMYSSRKLNNKKVITTAYNFWRQIQLLVFSRFMAAQTTIISAPSRLDKHWVEFPPFFHLTNIDVTSCFCRQFFRALYEDKGQKIAIFNCEYLGDACVNWAETS